MQILTLGGAGAMAGAALRHLATTTDAHLVVADRDARAAWERAVALGPKASARTLDLADTAALTAALRDADLVLNLAGPYYRFGTAVLDAAIATGTHYLDVCDDPVPTLAMLDRHDAAADAGVVAVVGMGASPGVSNLLARVAADRLDQVHTITTGWPEDPDTDREQLAAPSAALVHWVHQCAHPILVLADGRLSETRPLQTIELEYPGVGRGRVVTVGHPEAVTLQRAYPDLRHSRNVMVITPGLHRHLERTAGLVAAGMSDTEAADDLLRRLQHADLHADGPAAPFAWLFALAEGVAGGIPATTAAGLAAYPPGGMAGITGIPLAIAARFVMDGSVRTPGVHPPETAVPPKAFLTELARWCEGGPTAAALVVES